MQPHCKNLIILDFDHTLFNTTKFVNALKKTFKEQFNIDEEHFMKHRNNIKECNQVIDIDNFINAIAKDDKLDKQQLHDAIHNVIKTKAPSFIFDDVHDFLEKHKDTFDILISTHGDDELQTEKIIHSNLPSYINHIISKKGKDKALKEYVAQYHNIHLIEDKAKNIDAVKTAHPNVTTYFLRRPEDMPYGNIQSTCDCADHTIKTLNLTIPST